MEKHRNLAITILITIGSICLVAGCLYLLGSYVQDRNNRKTVDALKPSIQDTESGTALSSDTDKNAGGPEDAVPDDTADSNMSDDPSQESSENIENPDSEIPEDTEKMENPYRDSFLANEDMAAWLLVPGTNIDYPVMWTPRDENYYLNRGFDGKDNQNGCLILDTDSCLNPLSTNLIIHGHNMRSGAMFGNLTDYEDAEYGAEHALMYLYTPECQRRYEVIAVFRSQVFKKTDSVFKFYQFFQADTQEEFDDFYQNIKEMSIYDTGVTAEFGDCFLTLSTCAYHVDRGRFVVVAKEVESGDFYLPLTTEQQP